ncbi:MAG: hypothetical protein ACK518_03240 [bacterium]
MDFPSLSLFNIYIYIYICRFGELEEQHNFLLAAAVHPIFKLNWITNNDAKKDLIKVLLRVQLAEKAMTPVTEYSTASLDDFLKFPQQQLQKADMIDRYLVDSSTDVEMLEKYPPIKELFVKLNTPIPSSDPVERLFSQANVVFTSKRNQLGDGLL